MILLPLLREHLLQRIEFLRINPDRLIISTDKGRARWRGLGLSHLQEYTALVEIDEYPYNMDASYVICALIEFYQLHQDVLPDASSTPLSFDTFMISNTSTTVRFSLDLTETVTAVLNSNDEYVFNTCTIPDLSKL